MTEAANTPTLEDVAGELVPPSWARPWAPGEDQVACGYPNHRPTDWITRQGVLTCGTCHPPAIATADVVRRGEPGFDELVEAARC